MHVTVTKAGQNSFINSLMKVDNKMLSSFSMKTLEVVKRIQNPVR